MCVCVRERKREKIKLTDLLHGLQNAPSSSRDTSGYGHIHTRNLKVIFLNKLIRGLKLFETYILYFLTHATKLISDTVTFCTTDNNNLIIVYYKRSKG